ncbi:hypothetical protein CYY_008416 [Polysphondylium violaceum]|uniref:C2 domain-containing protein n=1 Tax=Polysphondylium violaceum TaxID=133409 RepID=A0A8J4PN30_9MYCE|nr:hypothetical protein CYY_008416 [Polysphondylium violaceum]
MDPSLQQQYYPQQQFTLPIMDPQHPKVLARPMGAELVGTQGLLQLRILSGENLVAADLNNKSDPFCKVRAYSLKHGPTTKYIEKTLNPIWNETISIAIQDIEKEIVVIEVIDFDSIGQNDPIGFFALDLTKLPKGIEVITRENLQDVKHGRVEIGVTAVDFGLINIPPTYIGHYIQYRQDILIGKTQKEIKSLVSEYRKDISMGRANIHEGPFIIGKLYPPEGFKLRGGWVRKDKKKHLSYSHEH